MAPDDPGHVKHVAGRRLAARDSRWRRCWPPEAAMGAVPCLCKILRWSPVRSAQVAARGARARRAASVEQRQGVGCGEGPEFLYPAQRGHPDERVKAHSCVGDHPHGVADPEERSGVGGGLTASPCELAGEGADRQEHDRGRDHSWGEVQGRPERDADTSRRLAVKAEDLGSSRHRSAWSAPPQCLVSPSAHMAVAVMRQLSSMSCGQAHQRAGPERLPMPGPGPAHPGEAGLASP